MSNFFEELNSRVNNVAERTSDFAPIPEGWYKATIKDVQIKDTKDGTGKIMNFRFDIVGPTNAGRVVFNGLNIRNKNPKTEEYALQDLKQIRQALGLGQIKDTNDMIGKNLEIKVAIKEAEGQYEAKNITKGYKAIVGGTMPMPTAATTQTSKATPPWAQAQAQKNEEEIGRASCRERV